MTSHHHTTRPSDAGSLAVDALSEEWGREPWEPWKPEVGQRVRVRMNGECEFEYSESGLKHFPGLDGAIGVVDDRPIWGLERCCHADHDPSHRYTVRFDPPAVVAEGYRFQHTVLAHCFCAAELQPADARDDEGGEGN